MREELQKICEERGFSAEEIERLFSFLARLNPDGTPPAEWIGEPAPKDLAVGE